MDPIDAAHPSHPPHPPMGGHRTGALLTAVGVAAGAFGAHALADQLAVMERLATWDTAVRYHLIHGVAMFALPALRVRRTALVAGLWLAGVLLFSGSLYALSTLDDGTGTWNWLGAVTPFGGTALIAGWVVATFGGRHGDHAPQASA